MVALQPERLRAGALLAVTLFALAAWAGVHACPLQNSDMHLNGNQYAITASDEMVALARGWTEPANRSNGSIVLGTFKFQEPEKTGDALALGAVSASIYCPKVANAGCHGASVAGEDGNSTCIGCAGTVSVTVLGLGAFVSSGNDIRCACRPDGTVLSPPTSGSFESFEPTVGSTATRWDAQASNPDFYEVSSNTATRWDAQASNLGFYEVVSNSSNCSTADCTCNSNGIASGPGHCGCSCTQQLCNNCSCSDSGVASGDQRCGCSCNASICSTRNCSCNSNGIATGPEVCGCSCNQRLCIPMPFNQTINQSHTHGNNCSCSNSGVASGDQRCGCSCNATIFTCACTRQTCRANASADGKTFTSTGGTSQWGGGTCRVTAACSAGFYNGAVYSAYTTTGNVFAELIGPDGPLSGSKLGMTTPSFSAGVFRFQNLYAHDVAMRTPLLKLKIHAGASGQKYLSSPETAPFAAWPTTFKIVQTADTAKETYLGTGSEYKVNDQGFADLGNYTLFLLDSRNNIISLLGGNFNATVDLITGANSDSSNCDSTTGLNYPSAFTDLTANSTDPLSSSRYTTSLVVLNRNIGGVDAHASITNHELTKDDTNSMRFGIHIRGQVGNCFALLFKTDWILGPTKYKVMKNVANGYFRIVPGKIAVAHGDSMVLFQNDTTPDIVRVDGTNTNATINVDGLPNPLHVFFQDGAGQTLEHASCRDCVQVRLVKCTDSNAGSPTLSSAPYPACASVAQAECAGSSSSKCSGDKSYLDTLTGTTVVNMLHGIATFTDIQVSFVVGAGYKLQFTHNAMDLSQGGGAKNSMSKTFALTSTAENVQVLMPPALWLKNSFFVRPYSMTVTRIGGDGVDEDQDGSPDGVATGIPFRWQPTVVLKGKDYDFNSPANMHGWTPVFAELSKCGGDSCEKMNIKLSSNGATPPAYNHAEFNGTTMQFSGTASKQTVVHAKQLESVAVGKVGFTWSDLKIDTSDTATFQNNIALTFKVGPGGLGDQFTSVVSNVFDVFTAPDPPHNLRVYSYDELGFRLEFDPAPVSEAQPLTGYIIEIDECHEDATRCIKRGTTDSPVCAAERASKNLVWTAGTASKRGGSYKNSTHCFADKEGPGYWISPDVATLTGQTDYFKFEIGLGGDWTTGGGGTEEVLLNYSGTNSATDSEVRFSLRPSRTLQAGDALVFDFGLTYKFKALGEFTGTACIISGDHASLVEVSGFDSVASTLTLKVQAGQTMLASKPVMFVVPETCKIKLPPKNDTSNGFDNTKPTSTIMYASFLGQTNTSRGDNCKGTTPGCVAKKSYVLPLITDSSPSDTKWSGTLTGGGNDDSCTSGTLRGSKLCTLSIGKDWSMGASVKFNYTVLGNETKVGNSSTPLVEIIFARDRALAEGDWIDVPVQGLVNTQPSEGKCDYFLESATQTSKGPVRWSSAASGGFSNFTDTSTLCRTLKSEVFLNNEKGVMLVGWETVFDVANSNILIYVGSGLLASENVKMFVHGFSANTLVSPGNVVANVRRGGRTTVIFKNQANTLTYSTLAYDPVGIKAITQQGLTLEAGKIYNFRVYAFNGRFRSAAAQTRVQNRAITKPAIPAYFSQIKQDTLGVEMRLTNLLEDYVRSTTADGTNVPTSAPAGESARVGMRFTSHVNIKPGSVLTVELPNFDHTSGYLRIGGDSMFADKYVIDGMVHTSLNSTLNSTDYTKPDVHRCGCGADGTVLTPRNRYRVTRLASGYNATNDTTEVITGAASTPVVPGTACGGCRCSLQGVPATPPTIYETQGNCSSCQCDANGVSSHVAPYQVVQKPEWAGTYNSSEQGCVCSSSGLMSSSNGGNCTMFQCSLQVCACSCPLVLKCECGCELYESYKCKCVQTEKSELFESVLWSSTESSLVLTVGKKGLVKNQQETFFIARDVGIKTPAFSADFDMRFKIPKAQEWGFRNEARLPEVKLNWVSSHPTSSQPRLGFVAQFTTDLNWKTDIQTVHFPDASWDMLSEGFTKPAFLGTTSAAVGEIDSEIPLQGAEWLMPGQTIVVSTSPNDESMRVVLANSTHITVVRTRNLAHAQLATVDLWSGGALDVDRPSQLERAGAGYDLRVGSPGDKPGETSCRIGNPVYAEEGCNPSKRIFPNTIRHFNSGTIAHEVNSLTSLVSACGGNTTHCTTACNCIENSVPVNGADIGSLRPTGTVQLVSSGDVLAHPLDFRGRLVLGLTATSEVLVLDMDTSLLLRNYIRVGDEVMFVTRVGGRRGAIKSVGVHRIIGGRQCECDISGTATGGTGCSCFPTTGFQGTNCTAGGTLALKEGAGGGSGFAASFTVASGKISSITVTAPGQGYGTLSSSDVYIASGGTSAANYSCQVTFYPAVTPQYVTVARAQLGTTASAATAGAKTFAMLWASQTSTKQPTKRYSFRLAAYNNAGMSPFLYYDLDLKQKNLQKFLTAGNQLLEISLVGGGVVSNNVSVHFVTPGTTDITKGKECGSVLILDKAGTRLTCRTPSWVGAKLDLIVSYKSGMFSNFVVGGGWVSYTPPTVQSVTPALVDIAKPGESIVLLVQGSGFGTDSNDVTGKLVGPSLTSGDVPGEIRCNPLVVLTDTSIRCTLTTKSNDEVLEGDVVITAGNATFHGGGQSTQTGPGTAIKQKPPPVEVRATIAADFTEITSSPAKTKQFKATFVSETASAIGISPRLLEVMSILQGSVIVIFNILPDTSQPNAVSPAVLAVKLAQQAADPNSKLRQGSLTGAITISLPPGTAELAAASLAATTVTSKAVVPGYFKNCVPRTYTAWDMEICYDCCTYLCETGTEVPQMGGQDVLPGYRAQVCQSECMTNCGYARPLSLNSN